MTQSLRTLWRLCRILRTLARHDALTPLQNSQLAPGLVWVAQILSRRNVAGRAGQKLARALVELGPSFVKFGQVLSTRADLIGEEMAKDLSDLQDRLPPFDAAHAREILESELDCSIHDLFASFENKPVSAASIAQVHMAITSEGDEVAVKILRPGIERDFERDLAFFFSLAELAERTQPKLRRLRPTEVVQLFADTVRLEMDLRMEGAAATELAENFADDPSYRVPAIDWTRSSKRVLTMGRLSGIPIDDRQALLEQGHDLTAVLTTAAEVFFHQVFRDGFFHGDQHPGNMSIDPEGHIIAVDFGIMGRLDLRTRRYLADMLVATLQRDYQRLAQVHVEAGFLPPGPAPASFAQALRAVCDPIAGRPLRDISFARLLAQLLQLTEAFNMPVQPQLLLLQKNMLMAEGISRQLSPDLNIWTLAQPLIENWIRENRGPDARLREGAEQLATSLERLPHTLANLESVIQKAAHEGLPVDPEILKKLRDNRAGRWQVIALWIGLALLGLIVLTT
ncbi:MAG: 2-polyprenylphenol 6-hydroxylase [Pseudomonadota bacterium]